MKKILTLLTVFACVILSSCSSGTDAKGVAEKLEKGETLTEQDYKVMIEYCGDYAKKAQTYFDILNSEPNDSTEAAIKATDELANLNSSATYLDIFRKAIYAGDENELGSKNVELVKEYSNYEAFPLPAISDSSMLNPDVIGDVVEMPVDSSAVIASGDGEVVESN